MAKVQKVYTRACKEQAVQLAQTSGKSIAQLERRAGHLRHVYAPMAQGTGESQAKKPLPAADTKRHERRKTAAIPRELERAQQERDLVKKVVGIFSRESRGTEDSATGEAKRLA